MATTLSELKKMQRELERLKTRVEYLIKLESGVKPRRTRKAISSNGKKRAANGNGRTTRTHTSGKVFKPDLHLRSLLGTVTLGYPTGSDNESIDRDLAIEYGSTYEAP